MTGKTPRDYRVTLLLIAASAAIALLAVNGLVALVYGR